MKDMFKAMLDSFLLDANASSGQQFAVAGRNDPYKAFNFRITITGKKNFITSGFQKVTGLKVKTDVIEYREGNDLSLASQSSAGLIKNEPITLERGMSEDTDMYDWFLLNARPDMSGGGNDSQMKCSVKVELMDRDRGVAKTWTLIDAWCGDWEAADMDAHSNNIMIEKMIIHHNGFSFVNGKANA